MSVPVLRNPKSPKLKFYRSSIGKKVLMALTGLFLCSFLVEHLIGNLLLFKQDGGATFDAYGEFMSNNFLIRTIEIGLFAVFVAHIIDGTWLWLVNRRTRPQRYEMNKPSGNSCLASRITFFTGSIVFIFLVVHLRTFFVPSRFGAGHPSMYRLVVEAFNNPTYVSFYVVALILLGYHLRHGFQSAFQSLGLRHGKYKRLVDFVGFIFWFVIPAGYATMPIYFLWSHLRGGG